MQHYSDEDESIFISVYSVDTSEDKIIKKVTKALGIDFIKTNNIPEELEQHTTLEFEIDTIIVLAKDYNEDFSELSEKGFGIYIVP
jgi:hypothetical protein